MPRNVVVTGFGAVTPYGVGARRFYEGLRSGRTTVRSMEGVWSEPISGTYCRLAAPFEGEPDLGGLPRKLRRTLSRAAAMAWTAASEAIAQAGIGESVIRSGRCGVALGDTLSSPSSLMDLFGHFLVRKDVSTVPSGSFFRVMSHGGAANVAHVLGLCGRVLATPAACAAGACAVGTGFELIRWGVQDAMLCGGVEECHPATSAIFDVVGASSTHFNDAPERSPAPFDEARDGTVCGEGAGVLLLEAEEHARARGAAIVGRVLGYASSSDGSQLVHSSPESMVRCMRDALMSAGVGPERIGYVNAHATGTVQGDAGEAAAIASLFGRSVPVSGLKGYIGHTLGASGALEAIASLAMIAAAEILPTAKLENVAAECSGIRHVRSRQAAELRAVLKNSFGFGGVNAALVLGGADENV